MHFSQFVARYQEDLKNIATAVRSLSMDAVLAAKSGHIGLPLGCADIGTLLYFAVMQHDPKDPLWTHRDRFVLSAGHGSMLQYALLHLAGYDLSLAEIKNFRQLGSKTPGHPEYGHTPGVECTTGPLGQGFATAVGMGVAERMMAARDSTTDHRTFVLAGDGCLMEGVCAEAASLAGHLKLNRLIVLYDDNKITIDGNTDISFTEDVAKRFQAYGWNTLSADGNSFESLATALDSAWAHSLEPNGTTGPTLIVCKTIPGKGSLQWQGKHKIHGNPMSAEDVIQAKQNLGLENTEPFFVPPQAYQSAKTCLAAAKRTVINQPHTSAEMPLKTGCADIDFSLAQGKMATRIASGKALVELAKNNPNLVGGSADLAGSNLTTLPDSSFVSSKDFSGRNVHFGVREHAMAAMANGMTLHGFRSYCATFAVFSDYMRPAIRLAALMKIPTIFILTHDSYGVGEDGPTHQPIEHAASLRAIPNLNVFRPADAMETFVCWQRAVQSQTTPTVLLLTRQDLPDLQQQPEVQRTLDDVQEGVTNGAYLLKDFSHDAGRKKVVLIASGSEVSVALDAMKILSSKTFETLNHTPVALDIRLVSCPAPQVLARTPVALNHLVPADLPAIAIEAGSTQSFAEIVGRHGAVCGMHSFGESAPYASLAQHFGFTGTQFATFVLNQLHLRGTNDI